MDDRFDSERRCMFIETHDSATWKDGPLAEPGHVSGHTHPDHLTFVFMQKTPLPRMKSSDFFRADNKVTPCFLSIRDSIVVSSKLFV